MAPGEVIASLAAAVAAGVAGYFTRRSAKETTAVTGFTSLTAAQTAELMRTSERIQALEDDREESRGLAREHERWDRAMVRKLRQVLPDEEFPDPPPLDT